MSKFNEEIKSITNRLWELEAALRGIGVLLQQQNNSPYYSADDLFGLCLFFLRKYQKLKIKYVSSFVRN